jgi:DnaJ-class molecular chaperone
MEWKIYDWQSQKVGQKGEVLNRTDYTCGFCKGKGIIPSNKAIRCPACGGAATVRVRGLAVICAYCNGDGRAHLNRDLTCSVCKGKGIVPIESNNIEACPICKGRGRERGGSLPCFNCKGKGVVAKKEDDMLVVERPTYEEE